jgi:8-oxo-dGTP pyrophosphatase MutT (NUDIX family)
VNGSIGNKLFRLGYQLYRVYLSFARPLTMGVRIILFRDGQVLLIRQTYLDGWFIPGGGVQKGETLDEAIRRESREEVQAELRTLELLGAYSSFDEAKNDHTVLFVSDDFTLGGGHDREVAEIRFFPPNALPDGIKPGYCRMITEYACYRDPRIAGSLPPRFGRW